MITKVARINLDSIKEQRENKGITKSEMAKMMGFKTTEKYSRRENGEYNFQVDELPIMSSILKVPIKNFFS